MAHSIGLHLPSPRNAEGKDFNCVGGYSTCDETIALDESTAFENKCPEVSLGKSNFETTQTRSHRRGFVPGVKGDGGSSGIGLLKGNEDLFRLVADGKGEGLARGDTGAPANEIRTPSICGEIGKGNSYVNHDKSFLAVLHVDPGEPGGTEDLAAVKLQAADGIGKAGLETEGLGGTGGDLLGEGGRTLIPGNDGLD